MTFHTNYSNFMTAAFANFLPFIKEYPLVAAKSATIICMYETEDFEVLSRSEDLHQMRLSPDVDSEDIIVSFIMPRRQA